MLLRTGVLGMSAFAPAITNRRGGFSLGWISLLVWVLTALVFLQCSAAFAQDVQPVPTLTARVIDQTGTLDATQQAALATKLEAIERQSGSQIVVLLVSSTMPEDIAAYSQRVADTWKIGRRDIGDGLLIVVAKGDRRVRVEVAKTLEGAIPDLAAKRIIDVTITPAFRAGDFAGGLNAGVDQLAALIRGEALPQPAQPGVGGDAETYKSALVLLFFAVVAVGPLAVRIFGRKVGSLLAAAGVGMLGWWLTASVLFAIGGGVLALFLVGLLGLGSARQGWSSTGSSGYLSGNWGGSGGGGGGFSSGGGGDFGGGGASGRW